MKQPLTAWRSRLSVRLFATLLVANVVIGGSIYLFISQSMDRGFVDYLKSTQQDRLKTFSTELVNIYAMKNDWDWLRSRRNWVRLVHAQQALGGETYGFQIEQAPPPDGRGSVPGSRGQGDPQQRDAGQKGPQTLLPDSTSDTGASEDVNGGYPPEPPPPEFRSGEAGADGPSAIPATLPSANGIDRPQDYMLRDADGNRLNGPPRPLPGMRFAELKLNGEKIGELGYLPVSVMLHRGKDEYMQRQSRNLAIIMLSSIFASLLAAAGIAWWLGHRVRDLAGGASLLSSGDYATRLPVRGQDELSSLAGDFNSLAQTLESNRDSRQRWVSDISHELRTPLAVLKGEIEAMQDGFRPMSQSSLGSLAQEVDALNRLVSDLRLLAQSDAGTLEAWRKPLSLGSQIQDSLDDLSGWLEDAGISIKTELELPLQVAGDLQRLHQLWSNLASNTRAYTDAPGVLKVSLLQEAARPRDGADHPGWAVVRWEDSSPGVPEAELAHLTERLYRVENSRNRASGGSGLGLSIASALVAAHEGQLVPGQSSLGGLRWDIRLPLLST